MKKYEKQPHLPKGKEHRKEYLKQYHREYYLKNHEEKLKEASLYRENNKETIKKYSKNHWKNMTLEDKKEQSTRLKKLYNKNIEEFKIILGGKCVVCGTTEHLEFDHIDPKTKSFDITRYVNGGKSKHIFMEELKKCQLLCVECHKKKTFNW